MTPRIQALDRFAVTVLLGLGLVSWAAPAQAGAPVSGVALTLAQPSEADISLARIEYSKGEKAYRLGQFDEASKAFEKAYEKSGLPDILYNIGLSHLRWYDVDPDTAHLRKARVVFQNYIIELQKNPELGDLTEAEAVIEQIDETLAAQERSAAAAAAEAKAAKQPMQAPVVGSDPGKKQRVGGAVALGVGGALVIGGVVSGVVLGQRSQEFEEQLANAYQDRSELMCLPSDGRLACAEVNNRIAVNRANGRSANALSVGLGLSLGGLGLAGIVTGAVLLVQGKTKTKAWEQRLSVVPSWSPDGAGLAVSGRF